MMRPRSIERSLRTAALGMGDALGAWACLALAVLIRRNIDFTVTRSILPPEKFALTWFNVVLVAGALVIAMAASGFYNGRVSRRHRPVFLLALLIQMGIIALGATLMERPYPRTILLMVPLFEALLIPVWRKFFQRVVPIRPRQTILIGIPEQIDPLVDLLADGLDARIRIAGVISPTRPGCADRGVEYLGSLADLEVAAHIRAAEEVIYVPHDDSPGMRLRLLALRRARGFLFVPNQADALLTTATFGWVGDYPLVEVAAKGGHGVGAFVKRFVDLVLGSLLTILAIPVSLLIAIAIAAEGGRPVLLRQRRAGRDGVSFMMWKFRTMHPRTGEGTCDLQLAGDEDPRVTRVGWWLRRHRLDELPQLLNVLRGEMSLVGPRPERPEIIELLRETIPEFDLRLMVKPGLAGLAQVWAEYDTKPATKLRYDLTYICSWTPTLDFRILATAITTALAGRGV